MTQKNEIQTNLLGRRAKIMRLPNPKMSGKEGEVVAVYLADGEPVLSLLVDDGSLLKMVAMWLVTLDTTRWSCVCGAWNADSVPSCASCGRDRA